MSNRKRKQEMAGTGCGIILLSKCLFLWGISNFFFQVTYWVTAIIDYINGLPLEKESNYIFVQIAKCRLISNFLGSLVFFCLFVSCFLLSSRSGAPKHGKETWTLRRLCLFIQQIYNELLAFCMHQLCSRHWKYRGKQDNVSVLLGVSQAVKKLQELKNPKCS